MIFSEESISQRIFASVGGLPHTIVNRDEVWMTISRSGEPTSEGHQYAIGSRGGFKEKNP